MNMTLPRKKNIKEVDASLLTEPRLSDDEKRLFQHGIELFNGQHYWHAHEVWEELWKRKEEESRIFFQGIIQTAAAYHRIITDPKYNGALNNIDKALAKLELFPATFLGIDVKKLRKNLMKAKEELQKLGRERMKEFPEECLPLL
ncbi:MAG: DUF309 domain-containing protein [Ignavibacteriae bacterium]|nr:DUF309 domain-containing protein [Ignavibacteriota bacterium]